VFSPEYINFTPDLNLESLTLPKLYSFYLPNIGDI